MARAAPAAAGGGFGLDLEFRFDLDGLERDFLKGELFSGLGEKAEGAGIG